jgi:hypothetical protein
MIDLRPRPLPLYVHRKEINGRRYLYFRWQGSYARLPDDEHSQSFRAEYARLFNEHLNSRQPIRAGSVNALIKDVRSKLADRRASDPFRHDRLLDTLAIIGNSRASSVRRHHIIKLRDQRLGDRRLAKAFVELAYRVFQAGVAAGYVSQNPVASLRQLVGVV